MLFNRQATKVIREQVARMRKSELAEATELSAAYITQLEQGVRDAPTDEVISRIAKALGVDPEVIGVHVSVDRLLRELVARLGRDADAYDRVILRLVESRAKNAMSAA